MVGKKLRNVQKMNHEIDMVETPVAAWSKNRSRNSRKLGHCIIETNSQIFDRSNK